MNHYFSIVVPLLLHLLITEIVAVVFGGTLDAAARTLLAALLVLPLAAWMYRADCQKEADRDDLKKSGSKKRAESGKKAGSESGGIREKKITEMTGKNNIVKSAICFAGGGVLNLLWSGILTALQIQQYFSNSAQEALFAGQMVIQILAMGFFVPLAEELIFRGLIYRRMRRMLPYGQSVVLSSLLFAVCHGNMIQMIFALPMAMILAVICEEEKGVRYPVLFHMGCNLTAILANFLMV